MSSSNTWKVLIDDTDGQIQYTGPGWFLDTSGSQDAIGNKGPTYLHTLHGTTMNGNISFTFRGTQVTVWGTAGSVSGNNAIWECFIDNVSIGTSSTKDFELPVNNAKLCTSGALNDGTHELTINVTTAGQTFWLDCIGYIPSPSLSLESAVFLIYNTDPGITYDSSWSMPAYSMTQTFGSTASFNFTGTGLSWLGLFPEERPHSSSGGTYSIDGGSQVPFYLNGLPNGENFTQWNQLFFSASNLSAGPHTLQVTYQGNSQLTPLTLDYLYVTNTLSPSTTTSNANTSTGTDTSTPLSSVHPSNMRGQPVGAIIGGVIGGTSFIILVLALFFWYKWKRDHAWRSDPEVTPYSYDAGSQSMTAEYSPMLGTSQTRGIVVQPDPSRLPFRKSNIPRPLQEDANAPPSYTSY